MHSRQRVITVCCVVAVLFIALLGLYGYDNTWRLWNIPTIYPHFGDLRSITHGAETYAQGMDPMIENPADPWQRRMNYPRVWQGLYSLGIHHTHTTALGLIIIGFFLAGICFILPQANNTTIALVFAAVLSPATLFGVERCNIDLLMFFFAALSVLAIQRSYLVSAAAIMIGFVLKLFPVFACVVLFKAKKTTFLIYMFVILTLLMVYGYVNSQDLLLIRDGTPRGTRWSYGIDIVWMRLIVLNTALGVYVRLISYLYVFLMILISFTALFYNKEPLLFTDNSLYLDSFRVGASIYVGTFVLGNNWDYRLMFLIFVIPQLIVWSKRPAGRIAAIAKIVLLSVYISLWYFVISGIIKCFPYGCYISFLLDEMANWVVFSGLMYLFFWSLPLWTKECVRFWWSRVGKH